MPKRRAHCGLVCLTQAPSLSAARAFAFAASSSRLFGAAFVWSERRRRVEMPAISFTAARNKASFAFDGLLKPLIFLTNWSEAARISSEVTGGSKLKRVLMFLHIYYESTYHTSQAVRKTLICFAQAIKTARSGNALRHQKNSPRTPG